MNNNNPLLQNNPEQPASALQTPLTSISNLWFGHDGAVVDAKKIVALTLTTFALFLLMAYLFGHFDINGFTYTHYLFNYENGFIKRGLVGTAFVLSDVTPTKSVVNTFAVILFFMIAISFAVLLFRPAFKYRDMSGLWIFGVVAITHNSTIQHYLRDFGRFDGLGLVLMVISIFVVDRLKQSFIATFFMLAYLFGMMSLVHEANFLAFAPPVIAYYTFIHRDNKPFWRVLLLLLTAAGLTFIVARAGVVSEEKMLTMLANAESKFGDLYDDGFNVLARGFGENLRLTFDAIVKSKVPFIRNLWLLILTIPVYSLLKPVLQSIIHRGKWPTISLLMSVSALSLHLIGIDHIRWNALAISNCLIFIGLLATQDEKVRTQLNEICLNRKRLATGTILLAIATGPFGILSIGW